MGNRKGATEFFIEKIKKLNPNSSNVKMYEDFFAACSDKEFDELMGKLERGEVILPYFVSNLNKEIIRMDKILALGDELGIDFFQRIWVTDSVSGVRFLTPEKYLVIDMPIRRQQQHLVKGKSVVESSKFTDPLSGQAVGASRSSRISLPELMIMESSGHIDAIEELIKVRGGDIAAFREARRLTVEQGGYNLDAIASLNSRPTSTETLKAFFFGMHIDNNL